MLALLIFWWEKETHGSKCLNEKQSQRGRGKKEKANRTRFASHLEASETIGGKITAPEEGHVLVDGILFGTGFIQEPDPKDNDFPLGAVVGAVDDPRSQEKVWQLPAHLLNQGSTNSCVGHACAHFILAAPIMSHSVDAIALWRRAQEIDEFPGNEGTNRVSDGQFLGPWMGDRRLRLFNL